jgi:hypothetical protein
MIDSDRQNFKRMMNALMIIYYKPELSNDALRVWWGKLENYEFEAISKAIDDYTNSDVKMPPLPADILKLCQHKVTIHARLASPLSQESNQAHAKEVVQYVAEHIKAPIDRRQWARDLVSGKKKSNWDGAINFAKEALKMPLV